MKVAVYHSENPVLYLALEEIKKKLHVEGILNDYDFIIFALNYRYPYENLDRDIRRVFDIDKRNYFAFHCTESIANKRTFEGISACFIKFENKGNISVYWDSGITHYKDTNLVKKLADYLEENKNHLNVFISAWHDKNLGYFVDDLGKELERRGFFPNLAGGVSSGKNFKGELRTFQFYDGNVIKDGFGILTFKNVDFSLGISLGFKPTSPVYTATKVNGYEICEVDGNKNFKNIVESFLKGLERKVEYLWYCPIVILDEKEGYVSIQRTFKEIKENSVEFFAPIPQNSKFMLSFGSPELLLESTLSEVRRMKQKLKSADVVFNFSCMARQYVLEERRDEENLIYALAFDSPVFGFATYGEIGPDKNFKSVKLYNETSLALALKERGK